MVDATPQLDIFALIEGIKAVFSKIPGIYEVEDYARIQDLKKLPMIAYEINGIEPNPEDGGNSSTGQYSAIITLSAYCIYSRLPTDRIKGKLYAASLAAYLCGKIRSERFGCPVGQAEQIHALPDLWEPDPKSVEVWRVDWQHACYFGSASFVGLFDGVVAAESIEQLPPSTEYFLGIAPDVGPAHVGDYVKIAEPPKTGELT